MSLYRGAALSDDRFAALSSFDGLDRPEEPSDRFTFNVLNARSGEWTHLLDGRGYGEGVTAYRSEFGRPPIAAALNRQGEVFIEGRSTAGCVVDVERTGGFTAIQGIGQKLYVFGRAGRFFYLEQSNEWSLLDEAFLNELFFTKTIASYMRARSIEIFGRERSSLSPSEDLVVVDDYDNAGRLLYGVAGPHEADFYICGAKGKILHFDGMRVAELSSPVRVGFTGICCAEDGQIYMGGAKGGPAILKGDRHRGFTPLPIDNLSGINVYSISLHRGDLYVADVSERTGGLYRLQGRHLERVEVPGLAEGTSVWKVDTADDVLWVMEGKAVHRFDGTNWERFPVPSG